MAKQVTVSTEGLKKLEEELEYLKTEKRKEVAENIKKARAFGDLSENSEYDEAKNEQAEVEKRIAEIEAMLRNVKVIEEHEIKTDAVTIGSKVKVYDYEYDEEVEYVICGSTEADPLQFKISDESPIGKTILGHKEGDEVIVEAPGGEIKLKIVSITRA